jgi:hypothetical protein
MPTVAVVGALPEMVGARLLGWLTVIANAGNAVEALPSLTLMIRFA